MPQETVTGEAIAQSAETVLGNRDNPQAFDLVVFKLGQGSRQRVGPGIHAFRVGQRRRWYRIAAGGSRVVVIKVGILPGSTTGTINGRGGTRRRRGRGGLFGGGSGRSRPPVVPVGAEASTRVVPAGWLPSCSAGAVAAG